MSTSNQTSSYSPHLFGRLRQKFALSDISSPKASPLVPGTFAEARGTSRSTSRSTTTLEPQGRDGSTRYAGCAEFIDLIADIFSTSELGFDELDYTRPSGMSFNPRPARVALILLEEINISDLKIITAAMIFESLYSKSTDSISLELAKKNFADLIQLNCKSILNALNIPPYTLSNLLFNSPTAELNSAALIRSAHWLDRLRHLHLAKELTLEERDIFAHRQRLALEIASASSAPRSFIRLLTRAGERLSINPAI